VVSILERFYVTRGLPKMIVLDHGPEFTGRALNAWAHRHGVQFQLIRPGKPVENAFCESRRDHFFSNSRKTTFPSRPSPEGGAICVPEAAGLVIY
jgi:transposase InsO family protein